MEALCYYAPLVASQMLVKLSQAESAGALQPDKKLEHRSDTGTSGSETFPRSILLLESASSALLVPRDCLLAAINVLPPYCNDMKVQRLPRVKFATLPQGHVYIRIPRLSVKLYR